MDRAGIEPVNLLSRCLLQTVKTIGPCIRHVIEQAGERSQLKLNLKQKLSKPSEGSVKNKHLNSGTPISDKNN